MLRWAVGAALLPTAVLTVHAALLAVARLASGVPAALPFLAGLGLTAAAWLGGRLVPEPRAGAAAALARLSRTAYVLAHELTHALAAWSLGGRLLGFRVGERGGHVDVSEGGAFVSLAPYCFPLYTAAAVLGYRLLLWAAPSASWPAGFLAVTGLTLSFHFLKTFEVLWDRRQPDLAAAGGTLFSLSLILLANGLVLLVLIELLFPRGGALAESLAGVWRFTAAFWGGAAARLGPPALGLAERLRP